MSRPASPVVAKPNKDVDPEFAVDASVNLSTDHRPAATVAPAPPPGSPVVWADLLLRTFNDLRDELVSTLWFVLGNREDAQDIAQEVFLRCWRTQEGLPEVHNLRAWIFRVGLNAAKDLQRSAWRRRVKPLLGAEVMPRIEHVPPARELEDRESLRAVARRPLAPAAGGKRGLPAPAKRRTDLRADRRAGQPPRWHRQDADAQRLAETPQGACLNPPLPPQPSSRKGKRGGGQEEYACRTTREAVPEWRDPCTAATAVRN